MTNPLEILKTQLEKALDNTSDTEDFKDSLRDAINACNLNSVAALEQWIESWILQTQSIEAFFDWFGTLDDDEKAYYEGVQFVEEKWHAITGMF